MTSVLHPMRSVVVTTSILIVLGAGRPGVAQTPGTRVLVMPFAAEVAADAPGGAGASLWLGEAAAVLLGDGLTSLGVGALTRAERVAAFDRLQLPMSSALTRATMIRVGESIGASDIVFGDVKFGQRLDVRVRTIRLGTGQELPPLADGASLPEIFTLFGRLSAKVAEASGRRASPAGRPNVPPLPLEAFESYVKGLVAATPAAEQRFLETALRLAPADARVLLALWEVYTAQELHDKALGAANAVPVDAPSARAARWAVAQSLIALKRLDGAFQELTALYARTPAASVANALGVVQLRRGPVAGTQAPAVYFKRAVDADPGNTSYLFNLGYAQALAPNPTEALASLREAVRFNAADGDAHLVMSLVLTGSGRVAEAQRELELARLLGTSVELSAVGGRVPAGLERLPGGLEDLGSRRQASSAPARRDVLETAAFRLDRGRAFVAAHRDREAIEELRRAVYLSPYEDEPHLLLGQIYRRLGQTASAIDEFKVALWSRETAAAHLALGAALLDSGDKDGALRAAERALALAPTSAEARDLLRRIGS